MTIQEACEEIEELLKRDMSNGGKLLNNKEFVAINKVLLELDVLGIYECN